MNLTSPKVIKELLSRYTVRPSKTMGQNFLISQGILDKIMATAEIKHDETIVEVGPGIGTLTKELAQKAKSVIAIEKDKRMADVLKETLVDFSNIDLVNSDILKINFPLPKNYKVVANLPYYITSPAIRKFLEEENQPELMVLMVQKEVAQRICAKPPHMNLLAVAVQFYAEPKIISYVKKESFWPQPKIDSAIIKITIHKEQKTEVNIETFFKIAKAGFKQPRKQLINNLTTYLKIERQKVNQWLIENKVPPECRAETLNIEDWKNLSRTYGIDK